MGEDQVVAFVLLVTDTNSTEQTYREIKEIECVQEIYMIYGDYDIIVKVKLENLQKMTNFMMELRKKYPIKKSSTLITLS